MSAEPTFCAPFRRIWWFPTPFPGTPYALQFASGNPFCGARLVNPKPRHPPEVSGLLEDDRKKSRRLSFTSAVLFYK